MATSTVDTLNALLRGEIAATETYQQAMHKVGSHPAAGELRRIHAEHCDAANAIREHVHLSGGDPNQSSGAWGAFAKAVEGTARLFGTTAALKALKEGEQNGEHAYEDALLDPDLLPDCKALITQLLPRTREHIATLDRLIQQLRY